MKIALGVEYLGTDFHGWQIQKSSLRTVQGVVEPALSKIANHPVRVFCSGRTDAGVHAQEQVIHFETQTTRTEGAWLFGGNANLPSDVNFKWAKEVNDDFHARFTEVLTKENLRKINDENKNEYIDKVCEKLVETAAQISPTDPDTKS